MEVEAITIATGVALCRQVLSTIPQAVSTERTAPPFGVNRLTACIAPLGLNLRMALAVVGMALVDLQMWHRVSFLVFHVILHQK